MNPVNSRLTSPVAPFPPSDRLTNYYSFHQNSQALPQPVPSVLQVTSALDLSPAKKPRRRGLVLTQPGWQKLLKAGVVYNEFGQRYTFAQLSEQTQLDQRTVCRIVGRETGVDKRTLSTFFHAFSLRLEKGDYDFSSCPSSLIPFPTADRLSPEAVAQVKLQIIENCCYLVSLLGQDSGHTTLSVKLAPQETPQLEISTQ